MPDLVVPPSASAVQSLALVIPTFNEAGNIGALLGRLTVTLGHIAIPYELIVVDDASTDGTADRVREVAARDARVKLIVRQEERGLASAVVRGWQSSQDAV